MAHASEPASTIDPKEAAHFGALAADWWDPSGSSAMLHKLNPVRLDISATRSTIIGGRTSTTCGRSPAGAPPMSAAAPGCSPSRWRGWARR